MTIGKYKEALDLIANGQCTQSHKRGALLCPKHFPFEIADRALRGLDLVAPYDPEDNRTDAGSEGAGSAVKLLDFGTCAQCKNLGERLYEGLCLTCSLKKRDEDAGITYKYLLQYGGGEWKSVTKEEFVAEERRCGFHNTLGHPKEPATGGFATSQHGGVGGRVRRIMPK